jgi:hypothetical protein
MTVTQVFNFADGRTILAGLVEGDAVVTQPGRYGLYDGKRPMREVEVEGEMTPRTTRGVREERAMSVAERVGLPSGEPRGNLVLAELR